MLRMRSVVICLLLVIGCSFSLQAAQSTKDITASKELKQKAKSGVLGSAGTGTEQDPEYVIGAGDYLEVQVYGEGSMAVSAPSPTITGESVPEDALRRGTAGVQVRIDGRVSLKHIGEVEVVGMTLTQMADYLKVLYATVYEEPIVSVVLNKSNSKRYTVMGKVLNPGVYYLDYPINIVQVIARCGGFSEWANSELTVVREKGADRSPLFKGNTLKFDYDDFLRGRKLERNILIKAGDIIIVH